MKVVVTGGAGFIGHHLVQALLGNGNQVTVVDNLYRGDSRISKISDAEIIVGDIRDTNILVRAFTKTDVVIHLAAISNVLGSQGNPSLTRTVNVKGTSNVARTAEKCGVQHVIFSSSREVYGEVEQVPVPESANLSGKNLYGKSKIAGERILQAILPNNLTILRLSNVVGSGDEGRVIPLWLSAAKRSERLLLYGGNQEVDFVSVKTVVEAILKSIKVGPIEGPINIGSGQSVSLKSLAYQIINQYPGTSLRIEPPRSIEVVRYQADIKRMTQILEIHPWHNPLDGMQAWGY